MALRCVQNHQGFVKLISHGLPFMGLCIMLTLDAVCFHHLTELPHFGHTDGGELSAVA